MYFFIIAVQPNGLVKTSKDPAIIDQVTELRFLLLAVPRGHRFAKWSFETHPVPHVCIKDGLYRTAIKHCRGKIEKTTRLNSCPTVFWKI